MEPEYTSEDFAVLERMGFKHRGFFLHAHALRCSSGQINPLTVKIYVRSVWPSFYSYMYIQPLEEMPLLVGCEISRETIGEWRLKIGK